MNENKKTTKSGNKSKLLARVETDFIKKVHAQYPNIDNKMLSSFAPLYISRIPKDYLNFLSDDDLLQFLFNRFSFIYSTKTTNIDEERNAGKVDIRKTPDEFWIPNSHVIELIVPDAKFLKDSLMDFIHSRKYKIKTYIYTLYRVKRSENKIVQFNTSNHITEEYSDEFHAYIIIDYTEKLKVEKLKQEILALFENLSYLTNDFGEMKSQIYDLPLGGEARELLDWLCLDNFIFFGIKTGKKNLGMFKSAHFAERLKIKKPETNESIYFYRSEVIEYINRKGNIFVIQVGENVIAGLFTRKAETTSTSNIPYLKEKLKIVRNQLQSVESQIEFADFLHVVNLLPLDYRFITPLDMFLGFSELVYNARMKIESMLLIQPVGGPDRFQLLLLWPLADYDDIVAERLAEQFETNGVIVHTEISRVLSSIVFLLYDISFPDQLAKKLQRDATLRDFERNLYNQLIGWEKKLVRNLQDVFLAKTLYSIRNEIIPQIPADYRARNSTSTAVRDIQTILQTQKHGEIIRGHYNEESENSSLTLYLQKSQTLSYMVPVLSNFGLDVLDEELYTFQLNGEQIHIYKFHVTFNNKPIQDTELLKRLCLAFQRILASKASSEPLNKLVVRSGLNIQQVELLKALIAYLVQVRKGYSRVLIKNILERNPDIALAIILTAEDRFLNIIKPRLSNKAIHHCVKKHISELPLDVANIDAYMATKKEFVEKVFPSTLVQKELLDSLKSIISSIVRTTYFTHSDTISFKIQPGNVPFILEPRPYVETWVYHSFFEGVHLRGGPLARGGLRWSNRQDDFRSEVWGLWKTQVLKNTIIVPTGAKGGFVLKYLPNIPEYGIWAYKLFIHSLLEITDNRDSSIIKEEKAIPVADGHDPYLVVAADKGTATFSDFANEISISKDFWLSDAFASGGKNGYSHKELGITARGAWESARWHFYTQDRDPALHEFSVIGIGDMAGDVFGNGMLLSRKIKLVGVFNHRHIFLDPDPDPETSFLERKRLFEMNGAWSDYNKKLISAGGGVYNREAISIALSANIRKRLGTDKKVVTGEELIRMLLVAPVDMLFNGGIGTYVKSSLETNQDIDDIGNDKVRVDAIDLKCKMIVEGGNLGFSPRGRFQFSRLGGLVNTDAIDNSAGVDLSDHEVNLKILVEDLVHRKLVKKEDRNSLLKNVSDEAASLVLSNNFRQNWSLAYQSNLPEPDHLYFIDITEHLIKTNYVRANTENIPRIAVIREALQNTGKVPRSLISILLGYTKIYLSSEYTDIPAAYTEERLLQYFPRTLHKYKKAILRHPLRNEIVKLLTINEVTDNAGMAYFIKTGNLLSMDVNESINSYLFARNILDIDDSLIFSYLPDIKKRSFPKKISFETASQFKSLIENTIYRFIEMVQLFPQKGVHGFPKQIKKIHSFTLSKKTDIQMPGWARVFPENITNRISHWMYIEIEYIFNYLNVKLTPTRKEQLFLLYLEHGVFLKEVLYNTQSQNRWETQAILNLKRQFWSWVINEMPGVSGKDKRVDLNYEIKTLQERKALNISSLSGLIGFLSNGS